MATTARIMINGWSRPQVAAIKEQAIASDMSVSEYLRVTLISVLGLPPLERQAKKASFNPGPHIRSIERLGDITHH